MRKIVRSETPKILKENSKKFGEEFAEKKENNPKYKFQWRGIDKDIKPKLIEMTNNHCSFCDTYPLGGSSRQTIEHFRPKSKYPLLAYEWENLFLCCDTCQSAKGEKFDEKLLKPDEESYDFYKYFEIDYNSGEIKVNRYSDDLSQEKAKVTLEMYNLNSKIRMNDRLDENEKYLYSKDKINLNKFSYRFFLE